MRIWLVKPILLLCLGLCVGLANSASCGELRVTLVDPPVSGTVIFEIYDSERAFKAFTPIFRLISFPLDGRVAYTVSDLPDGEYALIAFHDANGNGRLDLGFFGFPKEAVGFANHYQPKGKPDYDRARFIMRSEAVTSFAVEMTLPFGKREREMERRAAQGDRPAQPPAPDAPRTTAPEDSPPTPVPTSRPAIDLNPEFPRNDS